MGGDLNPHLAQIASIMARYGGLTFGGGLPTMAALRSETVERHRWLAPAQFSLAYALSRLTPGTNMLAFSTALGWQLRGVSGAVVALIASSLPCSIVTVLLTLGIEASRGNRWATLAIDGAAASTIGIVAASCWQLMRPHAGSGERLRTVVLVVGAMLLQLADVAPVRVLLMAAIAGAFWREPR
jgi:chromate transporter